MVFGDGIFRREIIRFRWVREGGTFIRKKHQRACLLFPPCENTAKRRPPVGQKELSPELNSTGTLIWNFQPLELWENIFLLLSHPVYGTLIWQPEQTKAMPLLKIKGQMSFNSQPTRSFAPWGSYLTGFTSPYAQSPSFCSRHTSLLTISSTNQTPFLWGFHHSFKFWIKCHHFSKEFPDHLSCLKLQPLLSSLLFLTLSSLLYFL